jgi:hypothetical protein
MQPQPVPIAEAGDLTAQQVAIDVPPAMEDSKQRQNIIFAYKIVDEQEGVDDGNPGMAPQNRPRSAGLRKFNEARQSLLKAAIIMFCDADPCLAMKIG